MKTTAIKASKNVAVSYDPWKLLLQSRAGSGLSSCTGAEGGIVSKGIAQVIEDLGNPRIDTVVSVIRQLVGVCFSSGLTLAVSLSR